MTSLTSDHDEARNFNATIPQRFRVTLHNQTSMSWYLQLAHAIETKGQPAKVQQFVWLESIYSIPEGSSDFLSLTPPPGRFSLTRPACGSHTGVESVVGHASYEVAHGIIRPAPHAPFCEEDEVGMINKDEQESVVTLLQDDRRVADIILGPCARGSPQTIVRVSGEYYYRIVGTRSDPSQAISNDWAQHDWRPFKCTGATKCLNITVSMADGDLSWREEYVAKNDDDLLRETSFLPTHKLILTGDAVAAPTQLALLVLLEKEIAFRFSHVRTDQLPLNHPLRAPVANGVEGTKDQPTLQSILPFMNIDSPMSRMDGSEIHGVYTIAALMEQRFNTGTKLVPTISREKEKMNQWIETVKEHIQPLIDVLVRRE